MKTSGESGGRTHLSRFNSGDFHNKLAKKRGRDKPALTIKIKYQIQYQS